LVEIVMVVASAAAPTVALLVLPDLGFNDVPFLTLLVADLLPSRHDYRFRSQPDCDTRPERATETVRPSARKT
jgi:hypothetical protein